MSGIDIKDEQVLKTLLIYLTLEVFHFEISGKDCNELHSLKIPCSKIISIPIRYIR